MPVYDKPASATANTRTMQDETATKSSSEKSSEATTESAQSEDASALIFPNPCSEQFDLSERDAVLFDAAVAARNRTPNADICIPEIGVYGTYEEAEKTVIVCHVCYHFYYGCDGTEHYTDSGAMQAPAKAVLEVSDDNLLFRGASRYGTASIPQRLPQVYQIFMRCALPFPVPRRCRQAACPSALRRALPKIQM